MDNTTNIELIEKLYAGGGLCAEAAVLYFHGY